ncbi:MAG: hypothetical protein HWN51_05230, partial [Desulfobacterales bacterium]|nr:hypothetical protein [Desulfobacterales bacterium]
MNKVFRHKYRFLPVAFCVAALLVLAACSRAPQFREEIGPAGNEYIDPPDPSKDDSDQILAEYRQLPDSVRVIIDRILPGGTDVSINHWGPFRYTVTKSYADGHANKIFIYLTGNVSKILYIEGDYQERPGLFFITGS